MRECRYCSAPFEVGSECGYEPICCDECAQIHKLAKAIEKYCQEWRISSLVNERNEATVLAAKEIKKILLAYRYIVAPSLSLMSSFYDAHPRGELEILYFDRRDEKVLKQKEAHKIFFERVYRFVKRAFEGEDCPMSIAYLKNLFAKRELSTIWLSIGKEGEKTKGKTFQVMRKLEKLTKVLKKGELIAREAENAEESLFLQAGEPFPSEPMTFYRLRRAASSAYCIYCAFACALGEFEAPTFDMDPSLLESMGKIADDKVSNNFSPY